MRGEDWCQRHFFASIFRLLLAGQSLVWAARFEMREIHSNAVDLIDVVKGHGARNTKVNVISAQFSHDNLKS